MKRNFSQKIARIFQIVGNILLIPASLGFVVFFCLASEMGPPFMLVSLIFFIFGISLFIGCCKHSRGNLTLSKAIWLWIGIIFFNSLFMVPSILAAYRFGDDFFSSIRVWPQLIWIILNIWWIVAISLAISALLHDLSEKKYRLPE